MEAVRDCVIPGFTNESLTGNKIAAQRRPLTPHRNVHLMQLLRSRQFLHKQLSIGEDKPLDFALFRLITPEG